MKVKVTHTMKKVIQDVFPECTVNLVKVNFDNYKIYVDVDYFDHTNDFDCKTNSFKVFCMEYPTDYYASPVYITTNDLIDVFRSCPDHTLEAFKKALKNYYEI